jgi:adenine phosphoribosyltransferase
VTAAGDAGGTPADGAGDRDEPGTAAGVSPDRVGDRDGPTGTATGAAGAGLAGLIAAHVRDVPDYPAPGILFKDITPLLAAPDVFAAVVDALAAPHAAGSGREVDLVAGIEARGFILAAPVALRLGVGFVPVRKSGKLPHTTTSLEYALEYGTATIEVHTDAVRPGQRVLIVDDVLATGGTAAAALELLEGLGAEVISLAFLLGLEFLDGASRLPGRDLHVLSSA